VFWGKTKNPGRISYYIYIYQSFREREIYKILLLVLFNHLGQRVFGKKSTFGRVIQLPVLGKTGW
jgi:hypothetical protein